MSLARPEPAVTDLTARRDERRPAAAQRTRPRRRRRVLLVGCVLLLAAVAAWVVWWSPVLAVREIRVLGTTTLDVGDVRDAVSVPLGTPLARVSAADVTRRVQGLGPVHDVEVRYGWPDVLVVVVRERSPVAVAPVDGGLRLVDADDVAYAPAPAGVRLPTVQAVAAARSAAVAVLAGLPPALVARVEQVRASTPDDVVLRLSDGTLVRWGSSADGARKAEVLAALLARSPRVVDVSAPELPTTRGGGAGSRS